MSVRSTPKQYWFTCRSCQGRLSVKEEARQQPGLCMICYDLSQNESLCSNCGAPAWRHSVDRRGRRRRIVCPIPWREEGKETFSRAKEIHR